MLEFFLGGKWTCAQDSTWKFPGTFVIWTLDGKCGRMFGWKLEMDPALEIGRGDSLEKLELAWLKNPDGFLVGNCGRPPGWDNRMEFWSENVKVNCSVKWT